MSKLNRTKNQVFYTFRVELDHTVGNAEMIRRYPNWVMPKPKSYTLEVLVSSFVLAVLLVMIGVL